MSTPTPVDLVNVTIGGVQYQAQPEVAAAAAAASYTAYIGTFINFLNNGGTYTPTSADAANVSASINGLNSLAASGQMSLPMGQALSQVYATFTAAGIQPSGPGAVTVTQAQLQAWQDQAFATSSVTGTALTGANYSGTAGNQSLQALVELVYVNTGNEIISDNLGQLQSALSATSSVLTTLNQLQTLHNQITVVNKNTFPSAVNIITGISGRLALSLSAHKAAGVFWTKSQIGGVSLFLEQIQGIASAHFSAITPELTPSMTSALAATGAYTPAVVQFLQLRDQIRLEISTLAGQTSVGALSNSQSLLGQLRVVYSGMNTALNAAAAGPTMTQSSVYNLISGALSGAPASLTFSQYNLALYYANLYGTQQGNPALNGLKLFPNQISAAYNVSFVVVPIQRNVLPNAVKIWLLDNYSNSPNAATGAAGTIQTGINNAITSGENLNNQQQQQTQQYLFVFQQFYQSAAAILTSLTQLIQHFAQGISQK